MHSGLGVFLLLATSSAHGPVPGPCLCSALWPAGLLLVNCSAMDLVKVPQLPSDTTELHLQDNQLTAVSPGAFDRLASLRKVSLSGNRFHCDCRIQYLRNWLRRNPAVVTGGSPTCASPSSLALKEIVYLGDELFSCCAVEQGCGDVLSNSLLGAILCCLVFLLLWCLRLAKNSTFTLDIVNKHSGFGADSLRSQKPKHRRRVQCVISHGNDNFTAPLWTDDHETKYINMDLLPQIMDVLHKKHNNKIKAT
ncbi:unnamed protein product [Boreogadus saida]